MVDWTSSLTIESGNWLGAIALTLVMIVVAVRSSINGLSNYNRSLVRSAGLTVTGMAINSAWFALSRDLAPEGERWSPAMFEYRAWLVGITALMVTGGIIRFIWLIEDLSVPAVVFMTLSMASIALYLGIR